MKSKQLVIFTDGGSRGNPGESGIGVVVYDQNDLAEIKREKCGNNHIPIWKTGEKIGLHTNNEAEYLALKKALTWLIDFLSTKTNQNYAQVQFRLDSKLVVEQMQEHWKVKDARMKALRDECLALTKELEPTIKWQHIPREQNAEADALVNLALDSIT